jgi:hypothetical protein
MIWWILALVGAVATWWRCIILELRNRRQEGMLRKATEQCNAMARQNRLLFEANANLVLRLQWHEAKDQKVKIRSCGFKDEKGGGR